MKATATAKLGLNPKLNAKEKRTIMLLVCHNRVQKSYSVGGSAKYVAPNFDHLNKKHTGFKEEIDAMETKWFVAKEIIKELDKNFSFPKFKTLYKEQAFGKGVEQKVQRTTDLSELLNIYLADPAIPAKTKNLYKIGFNWIFRHTPKISVEKLTPSYYESLAEFIKKGSRERQLKCGVSPEAVKPIERATISSYFRGINGVGGYLLRKGYIESWNNAFASGVINVSKRSEGKAMMDDDLIKFANYCPSDSDKQLKELAWCFFMISFQLGGMNAIDLYGLKNRDLTETEVSFTRHKTANTQKNDTKTTVVIPELSKLIMGKYGKIDKNFPNDFVFSTFSHGMPELQKQYRKESENKKINKGLALICEELGLSRKYTVGGARHSQATYLHDEGVDTKIIDDISNRMSHSSTGMTEKHYIARSQRRKELIKGLLDNLVHETPYFNKDVFFKED